jgi:hypothetical protein
MAISNVLGILCQSCDGIDPSDIVDMELNCSGPGGYLTAGLVYSTPDGGVTASTLISMLLTLLFPRETTPTLIEGTPARLDEKCLTELNATRNCSDKADSPPSHGNTETTFNLSGLIEVHTSMPDDPIIVVGVLIGFLAGAMVTALIIALMIIW